MTVTEQAPPRQRASEPRINIDIATTRPGTPGGIFMRQFWHTVCRSRDLPAGSTKPLRIMSEDFAIYRTRAGVPQVVAYRCPHRGAPLHLGWVEDEAIRCVYHGWKFDRCGQCVEQPVVSLLFSLSVRKAGRGAETICLRYLPVLPKIRAAFTLLPPCPLCGAAYPTAMR